jgi:hypothetical protein
MGRVPAAPASWFVFSVCATLAGCATGEAGPKSAHDSDRDGDEQAGLQVSGTIGGMDGYAVRDKMRAATQRIDGCVKRGRKRRPYIDGEVAVYVQVDRSGRATEAYFQRSTLGAHEVETCILKVLRATSWPPPVGGDVGEISQSFGFDAAIDDPPLRWTARELSDRMGEDGSYQEVMGKLEDCRKEAGAARLEVTVYLDEDGFVQSMGVSSADAAAAAAIACVQTVVQTTSFPSPGSAFAKVTLSAGGA